MSSAPISMDIILRGLYGDLDMPFAPLRIEQAEPGALERHQSAQRFQKRLRPFLNAGAGPAAIPATSTATCSPPGASSATAQPAAPGADHAP